MNRQVGRHNGLKAAYYERQEAKKHIDMSGIERFKAWAKTHAPAIYQKLEKDDRESAEWDAYERARLDDPKAIAEWDDLCEWVEQQMQQKHQAEYALLGIEPGATKREIKNAYRRQARRLHPDKGGDAEAFKTMYAAYRRLLAATQE